jgi:transposase
VAVFTYDAPETVFLLSLFSKSPNSFQAATTFIAEESYQIADLDHSYKVSINYNQFYGMQQAYEFRLQENERVRRSELEKKSLEELRDSFHEYAEKAEETLQELIQKNNASLQKAANKIDTLAAEKARAFVNMQKQSDTNYQHWLENTKR